MFGNLLKLLRFTKNDSSELTNDLSDITNTVPLDNKNVDHLDPNIANENVKYQADINHANSDNCDKVQGEGSANKSSEKSEPHAENKSSSEEDPPGLAPLAFLFGIHPTQNATRDATPFLKGIIKATTKLSKIIQEEIALFRPIYEYNNETCLIKNKNSTKEKTVNNSYVTDLANDDHGSKSSEIGKNMQMDMQNNDSKPLTDLNVCTKIDNNDIIFYVTDDCYSLLQKLETCFFDFNSKLKLLKTKNLDLEVLLLNIERLTINFENYHYEIFAGIRQILESGVHNKQTTRAIRQTFRDLTDYFDSWQRRWRDLSWYYLFGYSDICENSFIIFDCYKAVYNQDRFYDYDMKKLHSSYLESIKKGKSLINNVSGCKRTKYPQKAHQDLSDNTVFNLSSLFEDNIRMNASEENLTCVIPSAIEQESLSDNLSNKDELNVNCDKLPTLNAEDDNVLSQMQVQ